MTEHASERKADKKEQAYVRVTLDDIYQELQDINKNNQIQHNAMIARLDITNGKVKLSKWIATTALSLALIALGYIITLALKVNG
jgi:hypothetical protein